MHYYILFYVFYKYFLFLKITKNFYFSERKFFYLRIIYKVGTFNKQNFPYFI